MRPVLKNIYHNRDTQFLLLQIIGWFSLSLISFFSLTLWYNQQSFAYVGHTLLQSLLGVGVSWPLRTVFTDLWDKPAWRRLTLTVLAVMACSLVWSVLRLGTFMWMTDETNLWADFGGWLFSSIIIFLCWTAFYHGIKYYLLLQSEHETLLKVAAANQQEQLKRSQAETMAQQAQLKMLRYQLNPHFLFNTLNAISALVVGRDAKNANTMIVQLSSFLRYSLENDPVEMVALDEEINALKHYLSIEQTRFADRLELEFDIDKASRNVKVPSLLLQPLVENAIKYAIAPSVSGGKINVIAKVDADQLVVEISDTGPGFRETENRAEHGAGIGLKNTVDRLRAFYADAYQFDFFEPDEGGLTVRICVPLEAPIKKTDELLLQSA